MKKGDKYVIEIGEVEYFEDDNGVDYPLARIKGFSALTFDEKGLDKLERVIELESVEEKKPYNCKFVVTESNNAIGLTVGKIYTLENGIFKNDYYTEYPSSKKPIFSFEDLREYFDCDYSVNHVEILEIKE